MRPLVFIFQVTILFLILDGIVAPHTWRNLYNRLRHRGGKKNDTETHPTQAKPKLQQTTVTNPSSSTTAHKPNVALPPVRQTSNGTPAAQPSRHNSHLGSNTTAQKPALAPVVNVPSIQVSPSDQEQRKSEQQPPHTPTDQHPPQEAAKQDSIPHSNVQPGKITEGSANKPTEQHGHPSTAEKENKTGTEGGGEQKDADKNAEANEQKVESTGEGHKHTGGVHEIDNKITGQADAPAPMTEENTGVADAPQTVQEGAGDHALKPKTHPVEPLADTPAHQKEHHKGGAVSTSGAKAPEADATAPETPAVEAPASK